MSSTNPFSSTIKEYVAKNHKDVADKLEIAELPAKIHAIELHYGNWPTHKSIAKFIDGHRKEESSMQVQEVWKALFENDDNDADDIPVDSDPVEDAVEATPADEVPADVVADAPAEVAVPEIAADVPMDLPVEEVPAEVVPEEAAQVATILDKIEALDDKLDEIEQRIGAEEATGDPMTESIFNKSDYAAIVNGLIYNLCEATVLDEASVTDVSGHGYKIAVDDLFTAVVNEEHTPVVWVKLAEDQKQTYAQRVDYFRTVRKQLLEAKRTRKMARFVEHEYVKTGALINTLIAESVGWPKSVDSVLNSLKTRFKKCISENVAVTKAHRIAAYRTAITELGMVAGKCKTAKCRESIVEAAEGLVGYMKKESAKLDKVTQRASQYISFNEANEPVDYTQYHQMIESYNVLSPTMAATTDKVAIVCEGEAVRNPIAALTLLKENIGRVSGFTGITL